MDDREFDDLTRAWARGASRRRILRGLLGVVTGGIGAAVGGDVAAACIEPGRPCRGTDVCCRGFVCAPLAHGPNRCLPAVVLPPTVPPTTPPPPAPTTTPTTAPPAPPTTTLPPPTTQPPPAAPTTVAPVPSAPPTTPAPPPGATLRVIAATCPPGLRAVTTADFARACGRPDQRADGLTIRLTGPLTATGVTGDGGQPGETVFTDLPAGPITLQTAPPPRPATVYAFCGADPAAPTVRHLSTGRQTGTGRPERLQFTLPLAPGSTLTCTWFTVPDDLSAHTGAILVRAATCALGVSPPARGIPGATCDHPAADARFALAPAADATPTARATPTPSAAGTTDADGLLRFGRLAPGRYQLTEPGAAWCRALSDGVDVAGRLVVRAGQRVDVWTYACGGR